MTHPVLQGMLMLTGCRNQQAVLLAYHTYMELSEVELLWDIHYQYNKELDIVYIRAKTKKDSEKEDLYIPISSSKLITPGWLLKVENELSKEHSNTSFILVIKEQDTTSVCYRISPGLVPPLSPEAAKTKKFMDEKQKILENEFKKHRSEIYNMAVQNLNVKDKKNDEAEMIECDKDIVDLEATNNSENSNISNNKNDDVEMVDCDRDVVDLEATITEQSDVTSTSAPVEIIEL